MMIWGKKGKLRIKRQDFYILYTQKFHALPLKINYEKRCTTSEGE